MLSREGVFRIVGGRTITEQRVALGAQADGQLDALIHTGVVAMTPHNNMPEPFVLPAKSVYASKTFFLDVETVRMNMVANTFMRAPGEVKELLKLAGNDSPLAGLGPDEVGGLDGGLCALDDESRKESYALILGRAWREEVTVEAEAPMPLELQHWSMHGHSALFCGVRVNVVTGELRVSSFLGQQKGAGALSTTAAICALLSSTASPAHG